MSVAYFTRAVHPAVVVRHAAVRRRIERRVPVHNEPVEIATAGQFERDVPTAIERLLHRMRGGRAFLDRAHNNRNLMRVWRTAVEGGRSCDRSRLKSHVHC